MEAITEYFNNLDTATLLAWSWKVIAALLIFVVGRWVARAVKAFVKRLMTKRGIDVMLVNFLGTILYAILLVAVIIASVGQLGIQTTPLIAVLGAAGLAVGLALQSSLSNLASGVMLVLFRPFTKGDFVEAAGTSGTVQEVGLFTSTLNTTDNRRIIVAGNPNETGTPVSQKGQPAANMLKAPNPMILKFHRHSPSAPNLTIPTASTSGRLPGPTEKAS